MSQKIIQVKSEGFCTLATWISECRIFPRGTTINVGKTKNDVVAVQSN